ncbi:MAG: protoglobin domain-containing protein [Pirellulales bacterium]
MRHIDETRLETDLAYRVDYLQEFIGIGSDDVAAVHAAAVVLAPVVPALVDAVYVKLFEYDATKRHFLPRQSGYEGTVASSLETLELDSDVIAFRKQHLGRYLVALVTRPYDASMMKYLDMVGKMHTPKAGAKISMFRSFR